MKRNKNTDSIPINDIKRVEFKELAKPTMLHHMTKKQRVWHMSATSSSSSSFLLDHHWMWLWTCVYARLKLIVFDCKFRMIDVWKWREEWADIISQLSSFDILLLFFCCWCFCREACKTYFRFISSAYSTHVQAKVQVRIVCLYLRFVHSLAFFCTHERFTSFNRFLFHVSSKIFHLCCASLWLFINY